MKSNWRKQMMISALALTLSAANAAPVFASAAPDGKSNAAEIAQTMGTTTQWNRWQKEWETLKNFYEFTGNESSEEIATKLKELNESLGYTCTQK